MPCVSNSSAVFSNISSIFLSSFCPKFSLSYPPDSIFRFISYLHVLNFLFPCCPPSSSIMIFNKSTCSSRLCRNFRCFFAPLLSISDYNFIFIFPHFTSIFSQLARFEIFSSTHYDWAHCRCISVPFHSSGFSNIFRLLGKVLPLFSRWPGIRCCVVRYDVLVDCSMTFRRLCALWF